MGGGGHHIGARHRALVQTRCHQAGNVGHIHHEHSAVGMGNIRHGLEVNLPRIGGGTGHNQLGLHFIHLLGKCRIVNKALVIDAVGHKVKVFAADVHGRAVCQVAAVVQRHTHHRVTRLQQSKIDSRVGLGTGVGLHIGILGTKQFAGALNGDLLHHIHILAAAVVTLAGQTFGIFVGKHRAHSRHHSGRHQVLRCDQLNIIPLALQLLIHCRSNFRVRTCHLGNGIIVIRIHKIVLRSLFLLRTYTHYHTIF